MADGLAAMKSYLEWTDGEPLLCAGIGFDRHLVARCAAPGCRRASPCDPTGWIGQGLGKAPLRTLETRLRCVCGSRRARLEMRPGPFQPSERRDVYVFR